MEPKIFGIQHIIYFVLSTAAIVFGAILVGKKIKTEKQKGILIRISGAVLLFTITLNRIFCDIFWPGEFLPLTLCGAVAFILGFCMIVCKKDSPVFQFLICTALVAATISSIYPDYIGQGLNFTSREGFPIVHQYTTIFCPPTITSLVHHSMQIFCSLALLITGWCKLTIKRWAAFPLGYCCLIIYGLFCIKILGKSNAMFINGPILSGTFLNWFWIGVLYTAVYTVVLFVLDAVENKKDCVLSVGYRKVKSIFKKS